MADCSSGILAIKQKIFHRPLDVILHCHDSIIKACCILHSFIHWNDGFEFEDTLYVGWNFNFGNTTLDWILDTSAAGVTWQCSRKDGSFPYLHA